MAFGRLKVLSCQGITKRRDRLWECLCMCGKTIVRPGERLKNGQTTSCGCFRDELRPTLRRIHGMAATKPHNNWMQMIARCEVPTNPNFPRYGGRGIKVCKRWHDFANFWIDMAEGYQPGLSIDRINNNGDYQPGNCRWATAKQQSRNRRSNRVLECRGERKTVVEWAEVAGIEASTIRDRLRKGFQPERAVFQPHRCKAKDKQPSIP